METSFTTPENNGVPFSKQLGDAVLHLLYRLVYFLFILPYGLWKNAVTRMYNQKQSHALDVTGIHNEWPFLSWLKRFVFEFLFDALTVIFWAIGFLVWFIQIVDARYIQFVPDILIPLYGIYIAPIMFSIMRDAAIIFIVMPIRWFISFLRRPAKTYDLTHVGKIER
jgi:hypothetical protein